MNFTLVGGAEDRSRVGRVERLRFLLSGRDDSPAPFDALAYHYNEEARLCWYTGAFVATILMTQLAFEETLRSHYRAARGVGGKLSNGRKVDDANFSDLIDEGFIDGWLSQVEVDGLHRLRKDVRNPYVHTRDWSQKSEESGTSFLDIRFKIAARDLLGFGTEDEAQEAIDLLVTLLPELGRRRLP